MDQLALELAPELGLAQPQSRGLRAYLRHRLLRASERVRPSSPSCPIAASDFAPIEAPGNHAGVARSGQA
ncbi:MAG: hypothetical protein C4306_06765 [Thermoleophilia bacterium]